MLVDEHLYNVVASAILSLLSNLMMVYVVHHSKGLTLAYRIQLYLSAFICLFYTFINVFVNPTIAVLESDTTVLFVKGGFETSYHTGNFLLDIFVILIMVTAFHPTTQFVYRYLHIVQSKNKQVWERCSCWFPMLLLSLILVISSSGFFCYHLEPSAWEIARYNQTTYVINIIGYTSFLVASAKEITSSTAPFSTFQDNYWPLIAMIYMALVMLAASLINLHTGISIRNFLRKSQLSSSTMKLHKHLNNTLIAQALIPAITIQLPFYVSCLAPMIGLNVYYLNNFLPFLFSYYSVLMPTSVILYSKDARTILCCHLKTSHGNSNSGDRMAWAEHR